MHENIFCSVPFPQLGSIFLQTPVRDVATPVSVVTPVQRVIRVCDRSADETTQKERGEERMEGEQHGGKGMWDSWGDCKREGLNE